MAISNFDFWLADGALLYALKDLSFGGRCLVDWRMLGSEKVTREKLRPHPTTPDLVWILNSVSHILCRTWVSIGIEVNLVTKNTQECSIGTFNWICFLSCSHRHWTESESLFNADFLDTWLLVKVGF